MRVYDRVRNQLRGFDGPGTDVEPVDLPAVPAIRSGGHPPRMRPTRWPPTPLDLGDGDRARPDFVAGPRGTVGAKSPPFP